MEFFDSFCGLLFESLSRCGSSFSASPIFTTPDIDSNRVIIVTMIMIIIVIIKIII